jgi:hypothetical protein
VRARVAFLALALLVASTALAESQRAVVVLKTDCKYFFLATYSGVYAMATRVPLVGGKEPTAAQVVEGDFLSTGITSVKNVTLNCRCMWHIHKTMLTKEQVSQVMYEYCLKH